MSAADPQPVSDAEACSLFAPFADQHTIAIAVSGGPDSTALLWLASRWRDSLSEPPKLIAVTVDHGLREESAREAAAAKTLSRKLGVAHRTLRWTGPKPKSGIQAAAREARYALIAAAARQAGACFVLTAHTLDDQAETVLLRLLRGSGPTGLQAMTGRASYPGAPGLSLARPLLALPKARLVATLDKAGIAFADDPSNRDPRFTRPRLRHLMPALAREGLTAERLATLARRLQRAENALQAAVTAARDRISLTPWGEGARLEFDRMRFVALPDEIGLRLLAQGIGHAGDEGTVELGKLESLFEALKAAPAGSAFRRTLAGAMVTAKARTLVIERAPRRRTAPVRHHGRRIPALTTAETDRSGRSGTR
ncbi:tRNA lysidine(34) synthetase TilS [Pseudorhodoplanes sp.]|uniref:tRNA lysidine(34) synthetase TilS n=1 Tax=Pseudorhodoplanes sp. TaxID=1934341 RepID=UPI00391C7AC9